METVYVDRIIDSISPEMGQSKPMGIKASNDKKYLLKTQLVNIEPYGIIKNEDAAFAQEIIAYELAKELNIPVPGYAVLEVEPEFLTENMDYCFKYHITKPGLYFGTEFIPDIQKKIMENYKTEQKCKYKHAAQKLTSAFDVSNSQAYADIIALDCFLLNGDRFTNQGNLIITSGTRKDRKVYAIDFGHCFFSPYWNNEKKELFNKLLSNPKDTDQFTNYCINIMLSIAQNCKKNPFGDVFSKMENYIYFKNTNPFSDIVKKIENISTSKLRQILYNVPDEWMVDGDFERDKYISFLSLNKYNVRKVITLMYNAHAFRHSNKGDELKWPIEKTIGIQ